MDRKQNKRIHQKKQKIILRIPEETGKMILTEVRTLQKKYAKELLDCYTVEGEEFRINNIRSKNLPFLLRLYYELKAENVLVSEYPFVIALEKE